MEEKKCTGCQTVKPVGDFSKWSRGKDGYQNYCKLCNRGYLKKFIADNFNRNTAYIIGEVERLFGQKLSQQYVRQIKSDWKVGKEKSTLKKLFGDFESYVNSPLTTTQI